MHLCHSLPDGKWQPNETREFEVGEVLGSRHWKAEAYVCGAESVTALQHTATHCNKLQHTATHRLQPTATHNVHTAIRANKEAWKPVLSHVSHDMQQTATHCNTLQLTATNCNKLPHAATRCNTLQHVICGLQFAPIRKLF